MRDDNVKSRVNKNSAPEPSDIATNGQAAGDDKTNANGQKEVGGRDGPDPTRFGDWEKHGRCIDF